MTEVRTIHGSMLNLLNPDPNSIDLKACMVGCAREQRYGNQLPAYMVYSVAEHTVIGTCIAQEMNGDTSHLAKSFFCHDISEGLGLRDLPAPIKPYCTEYLKIEKRLTLAVHARLGVPYSDFTHIKVKQIDHLLGTIEQATLQRSEPIAIKGVIWDRLTRMCERATVLAQAECTFSPSLPAIKITTDQLFGSLDVRGAALLMYACYESVINETP